MEAINYIFVISGLAILVAIARGHVALTLILIAAYCLRTALVYYDNYIDFLPGTGEDAYLFHYWGVYWIITSPADIFANAYLGSRLYGWFVSIVYSLFDENRFIAQWCNAVLACFTIRFFYLSALQLYGARNARRFSLLFAFWPTYVLFSSILLRESFVMFGVMAGIYYLVNWQRTNRVAYLGYSCMAFTLGAALHSGVILALVALPVVVLYSRSTNRKANMPSQPNAGKGVLVIVASMTLWIILSSGVGLQKFSRSENLTASTIVEYQRGSARDRTAYLSDVQGTSYARLVLQIPQRVIYFFLKPFPWDIQTASDVIGFSDAILYFFVLAVIFVRLRRKRIRRNEILLLGIGLSIAFTFALATSNYGTAIRHRMKVLPVLLLIAATPSRLRRVQEPRYVQRRGKR